MFYKLFNINAYIRDAFSFCWLLYSFFQTYLYDRELSFLLKFSEHIIFHNSTMTDGTRITYFRRYFSVTLVIVKKY